MMDKFFSPKSVAVVGASSNPLKVGGTIFLNLLNNGFDGEVFAVNPKHREIYGKKCYRSVRELPKRVDVVVVATPAETVPKILRECKKKGITRAIVISGGFGETGNYELEMKLKKAAQGMEVIGPNCLGVYASRSKFDTLFFSYHKLSRPAYGDVAIISQSGGIGSTILGLAAKEGVGIHSFISYGNAYFTDESDLLRAYGRLDEVKKVLLYVEGVKDGRKFLRALKEVRTKKDVVVLKAGKEGKAKEAATTHTGAIAGSYLSYKGAFRQAGVLEAEDFETMFDYAKVLSQRGCKGNRLGIITNGGGLGVMATDEAVKLGMEVPDLSKRSKRTLRKSMPSYVSIKNPLDIVADADVGRYEDAVKVMVEDENIDMLLVNVLLQPPGMNTSLVERLQKYLGRKPLAIVVPGGENEANLRKMLNTGGLPAFPYPERAVRALHALYVSSKRAPNL